jgi:poly(hydroxyalkanoate) granule-associated protein
MAGKSKSKQAANFAKHSEDSLRRVWLAGLGALSLARKHGGEQLTRLVDETSTLQKRTLTLVREAAADTKAQALGAFAPLTSRFEKQAERYVDLIAGRLDQALARLGIPTRSDMNALSDQVAALSRKLKATR